MMGGAVRKHSRKSFKEVQTVHRLHSDSLSKELSSPLNTILHCVHKSSTHQDLLKEKQDGKLFSEYQVNLIRESWKQCFFDKEQFSMNVYLHIFECEPELKIFFSWHDIEPDKLINLSSFRRQARAIMNTIDMCVQCLDNIQDTYSYLRRLGKMHTKLCGYGFRPENWHLFKLSILSSLSLSIKSVPNNQDCLESWNILITYVIEAMKSGFKEGMKTYLENPQM